ncbi:MAG: acetamidase/formamidase family protein [Burkholderiaceae bacterium]
MKSIRIDRSLRLRDDHGTGHNRWHPDIEPVLAVEPGEPVYVETRDAADGQVRPDMRYEDLARNDRFAAHPLTGPIFVNGARPGDLLEIEFVEITAQDYGWTVIRPGAGFLREHFHEGFLAHWHVSDGFARSPQVPGVRIPDSVFMGTAGVAPSHAQLQAWTAREADVVRRGGIAFPPESRDAVPAIEPIASTALRTIPPRENGGNADIKQLTRGSRLQIPVAVEGALFSVGDAHYAQGDSECCITAIEMGASAVLRFRLIEGAAARHGIRFPRFSHPGLFLAPKWAAPENFVATIGLPIRDDGTQESEDLTLASRNALLEMIALLGERGFTREQAYVICSLAVDLRISNAVDLPNVTVSALLPEAIFED